MKFPWHRFKPTPTVVAVFLAGAIGLWVVVTIRIVYDVALDSRDVALHLLWFMTLSGWWTELMLRRPPE